MSSSVDEENLFPPECSRHKLVGAHVNTEDSSVCFSKHLGTKSLQTKKNHVVRKVKKYTAVPITEQLAFLGRPYFASSPDRPYSAFLKLRNGRKHIQEYSSLSMRTVNKPPLAAAEAITGQREHTRVCLRVGEK